MADQRITGHAIHGELDALRELAERSLSASALTAQQREKVRRLQEVLDHLRGQLSQTRTNLVPISVLDAAHTHCQSVRSSLENFLSTNEESYIETANTIVDQALIQFRSLPTLPFKLQAAALATAADDYAERLSANESAVMRSFEELKARTNSEARSIEERLTASKAELDSQTESVRQRLNELEQQATSSSATVTKDAESKIQELRAEITAERDRLAALLTQHDTSFSAAQEKRLEDANTLLRSIEDDLTKKATEVTERQTELRVQSEKLLAEFEEIRAKANELLGFTGAANVAKAYLDEADAQDNSAKNWERITLLVFAVLGGVALIAFVLLPPDPGFSTQDFVTYALIRVPIFVVLAPVVRWIIQQAGHHRDRERHARLRGRELTAFRPFLTELDPEDQKKLIASTAPKYFGGDNTRP